MKNQYVADISDYRKYGLLRALIGQKLSLLVAWMLTADDNGDDGKIRGYLEDPDTWREHDPALFDALRVLSSQTQPPTVANVIAAGLLPGADDHRDLLEDDAGARARWFEVLQTKIAGRRPDVVFFDPDNGLEVRSVRRGRARSSKYVGWDELEATWRTGASLVVYQHMPRRKRREVAHELVTMARRRFAGEDFGWARCVSAKQVLFLTVAQRRHAQAIKMAQTLALIAWPGQLDWVEESWSETFHGVAPAVEVSVERPSDAVLQAYMRLLRDAFIELRSRADDPTFVRRLSEALHDVPEMILRFPDFRQDWVMTELEAIEAQWDIQGRFSQALKSE